MMNRVSISAAATFARDRASAAPRRFPASESQTRRRRSGSTSLVCGSIPAAAGPLGQQLAADQVAVHIVDQLELVQVEKRQAQRLLQCRQLRVSSRPSTS